MKAYLMLMRNAVIIFILTLIVFIAGMLIESEIFVNQTYSY